MRNPLLLRTAKDIRTRGSPIQFQILPIRHKSAKFLVPESFKPHLRVNKNRQNVRKPGFSGSRSVVPGQYPKNNVDAPEGTEMLQALDNKIEFQVHQESRDVFALSTESAVQDFCGQTHHPHVASSMKADLNVNYLNEAAVQLFCAAVQQYLPRDSTMRSYVKSPRGKLAHNSYSWASIADRPNEDGLRFSRNVMNLGWHLFLYTTPILRHRLLDDGTDVRFIPGPSAVWRFRLWAGGSINLYKTFGPELTSNRPQHRLERVVDLRIVGANRTPEKLFVTVSKQFFDFEHQLYQHQYSVPQQLKRLGEGPTYNKLGLFIGGPYLEEKYTLCFLRDPPNLSAKGSATRVIPPPIQPKFSHTLTPDRHLLFCWSALSYNAHLIHLDKEFARNEYGAKDLVVHGPLTLILVLEWFQREITRYAIERQLSRFHLESIDYKCLAPLFVDEPITLCTKPSKFPTPGTLAESWEVWVQKDLGDGLHSVAFKATIKLRIEFEPKFKYEHRVKLRQDSRDDHTVDPEAGDEGANDFKSPFF